MDVLEMHREFKKVSKHPDILVLAAAVVEVSESINNASHRLGTGKAETDIAGDMAKELRKGLSSKYIGVDFAKDVDYPITDIIEEIPVINMEV